MLLHFEMYTPYVSNVEFQMLSSKFCIEIFSLFDLSFYSLDWSKSIQWDREFVIKTTGGNSFFLLRTQITHITGRS